MLDIFEFLWEPSLYNTCPRSYLIRSQQDRRGTECGHLFLLSLKHPLHDCTSFSPISPFIKLPYSPCQSDLFRDREVRSKLDWLDLPWRFLEFLETVIFIGNKLWVWGFTWSGPTYLRTEDSNRSSSILTKPQDLALPNFCIFVDFLMMGVSESTNSFFFFLFPLRSKMDFSHFYPKHFNSYLTKRLCKSTKVS